MSHHLCFSYVDGVLMKQNWDMYISFLCRPSHTAGSSGICYIGLGETRGMSSFLVQGLSRVAEAVVPYPIKNLTSRLPEAVSLYVLEYLQSRVAEAVPPTCYRTLKVESLRPYFCIAK